MAAPTWRFNSNCAVVIAVLKSFGAPMTFTDYPSPIIQVKLSGTAGKDMVCIPKNEVFRVAHVFENNEYSIPPQLVPSGYLTIVDVGANVGLFALYMKGIRRDCAIHCFEPVPQALDLLQENIHACDSITVYPYALSNHFGIENIYLHRANMGENSLKIDPGPEGQRAAVQVVDAATVFRQIGLTYVDILKIDTEGCEVEILESLQPYLPYVGIVMAEYHSEADRRIIDDLLQDHLLFDARICRAQLGIVKYVNSRLLQHY